MVDQWPPDGSPAAEGGQAPEPHGQDRHHSSALLTGASLIIQGERKRDRYETDVSKIKKGNEKGRREKRNKERKANRK